MSEVNVDQLIIEVESDASVASENLDKLCASLNRFKDVINMGKPLNTFAKNMNLLGEACLKLNGFDTSKIAALGQLATSMSQISGVKISSTLGNSFLALNEAIAASSQADIQNTANMVEIVVGLGRLKGFTFPSSIATQLEKIAVLSKTIQGQDFSKLRELVNALLPLQQLANVDSKAMSGLASSMDRFTKSTTVSAKRGKTFNTVLANIRTRTLALVYSLDRVTNVVTSALGVYGDYVETLNLFEVSMDSAGGAAYEFAQKCQDLLGVDLTQFMKAQGVFMTLGKGFGIATENAAIMSQQLTQLAYDISSFYNISVADAVQKVQSGFSGELEPVRRLGYDLSQAKLQAIAMSMGIDQSVTSMTQAEKAQLRYIALLTQVTDAQGDLARTLESPTNQLRIFQAQVQQLARSFGLLLLPVLNNVLPYLIAMVQVLKYIIDEIAAVLGYELPKISGEDVTSNMTSGVGDLDDALEDTIGTAEKLKNTLASFDEINLITSTSGGGGKGSSASDLASAWNFDIPTYDFLGDTTGSRAKEIADAMKQEIQPALNKVIEAIKWIQEHTDEVKDVLTTIGTVILASTILGKLASIKKKFEEIIGMLKGMKQGVGIALTITGITLGYSGGKNLADGDIAKGLVEATLGAGLAGIGMSLLMGPAGFILGVSLSLVATITGYLIEDKENRMQEIRDFFGSVNDGGITLDSVKRSWQEFVEALNAGSIDNSGVEQTKGEVITAAQSVIALKTSYEQGLIDADHYVDGMVQAFADLKTGISGHLEELSRTIVQAFSGPLRAYALSQGIVVEAVDTLMQNITDDALGGFSVLEGQIQVMSVAYQAGAMDIDKFNEKVGMLTGSMKDLGVDAEQVNPKIESFTKMWDKPIDIDNISDAVSTLQEINTSYGQTLEQLHQDRADLMGDLQTMYNTAQSDERKKEVQELMRVANEYYDMQEGMLKQGLASVVENFESSLYIQWDKTLDEKGFDDTIEALRGGLIEYDEAVDEILGKDRKDTAMSATLDQIKDYDKVITEIRTGADEYAKTFPTRWADVNEKTKKLNQEFMDNYNKTHGKLQSKLRVNNDKVASILKKGSVDIKTETEKQSGYFGTMNGKISNMIAPLPEELRKNLAQIAYNMFGQGPNFNTQATKLFSQLTSAFRDDEGLLKKNLQNVLNNAASGINTDTNKNKFSSAGFSLMSKFKQSFTDPENGVKKTLQKTVDKVKELNSSEYSKKGKQLLDDLLAQLDGDNSAPANTIKQTIQNFKKAMEKNLNLGQTGTDEGEDFVNKLEEAIKKGNNTIKEAASGVGKQMSDAMLVAANTSLLYIHQMMMKAVAEWNNFEITNGQAKYKGQQNPPEIVPVYAGGGFPSSGEFFFANEDGTAEYVGSLGGKTAVANNQQIIEGVSDGVYRALKSSGIIGDVKMIAKKSGKVVFAPSVEAGRVMQQSADLYNQAGGRY